MSDNPRLFSFVGGSHGSWKWVSGSVLAGDDLPAVERLQILPGNLTPAAATWVLRGASSNERYVTRPEKDQLVATSPPLGRPEADCAVLIPIRKNASWWAMTQDERRRVFEEQSHHTQIGLDYLPAIARRLLHCRDLSAEEPFDFLTWFEFAGKDTAAFDQLLVRLRDTEEWRYVEREVELRFVKSE
ncbi:MAG: chlorite dismutase family protein [Luteolibacter sp.]